MGNKSVLHGFVGFVLLGCGVVALNCQSKYALQQEQMKCFTRRGISLQVHDGEIQNVVQDDPSAVCGQQEEYRSALTCAFDVGKRCLRESGVTTDILPDAARMADGIAYMCRHISEIDPECLENAKPAMKQCVMDKAVSQLMGVSRDVKSITCAAFQLAYDCMKEELHCPGRTKEVTLRLTNDYMRPPACSSFDDGNDDYSHNDDNVPYRFTTMAPMTTVQLVTTVMALPDVSCYDPSSIQRGQQECMRREGLDVDLPQVHLRSGMQAKQSYMDAILSNNKDIHTVCREKLPRQRAMSCAIDVARKCMPAGYKDYLPDSSSAAGILDEICDNPDLFKIKCATAKASELFDCGYRRGSQYRGGSTKDLLCKAFHWNLDCLLEVMPDCGCRTTRLYMEMGRKLNPPACPPIRTSTPECSASSDQFVSTNGAGRVYGLSAVMIMLYTMWGLFMAA